jgi:hypothetical protein
MPALASAGFIHTIPYGSSASQGKILDFVDRLYIAIDWQEFIRGSYCFQQ